MTEPDAGATPTPDDQLAPPPDHVVEGDTPDPVRATAPQAEPEDDDERDPADEYLEERRPAIFPAAGAQTGVLPPPVTPGL